MLPAQFFENIRLWYLNLYTICFFIILIDVIATFDFTISSHIDKFHSSVTKPTHLELDNGQAQARSTNGKILIGRLAA